MDNLDALMAGFAVALSLENLLLMVVGVVLGVIIGVLPGLGGANGVAILLPLTFSMSPVGAIILLSCIYWGALFGGAITSILFNIPGEPWSVATTFDGYPMAQQGRAAEALTAAFTSSFVGALFAIVMITAIAPLVAEFALRFGPPEFFAVMFLSFASFVGMGRGSAMKTIAAMMAGFLLACVGLDTVTGQLRLTFGSTELQGGIDFIPAMIGMFAVAEILRRWKDECHERAVAPPKHPYAGMLATMWHYRWPLMRGNVLGTIIGALPGAGGDIAAWISYAMSKRLSKTPEKFGTGHPEGLVESASQRDGTVLDRVVVVHRQIARCHDGQVEGTVSGQSVQHVIEEAEPGLDLRHACAIEDQTHLDLCLPRLANQFSRSGHGAPPRSRRRSRAPGPPG